MKATPGRGIAAVSDWLVVRGRRPGPLLHPSRKGGFIDYKRIAPLQGSMTDAGRRQSARRWKSWILITRSRALQTESMSVESYTL